MTKNLILAMIVVIMPLIGFSQSNITNLNVEQSKAADIGLEYLNQQFSELGLTKEDISELQITDIYKNSNNGWTQVYFIQAHNGVQVNKALFNMTIKPDGSIAHTGNRFVSNLDSKIDSDVMLISASDAIISTAKDLGIEEVVAPTAVKKQDKLGRQLFTAPYATDDIAANAKYVATEDGTYRLSWEVYLAEKGSSDTWYSYVDAMDGRVLNKRNNTVYCKVHKGMYHNHSAECRHEHEVHSHTHAAETSMAVGDGSKYRVLELPIESPIHGPFVVVEDPSNETASPFGWHDVNGEAGAEYTITRGNNVWAYEDTGNNNQSIGNEPDGGDELVFDFPYDIDVNPFNNMRADVTNMFYMCNMLHDQAYLIGFDSPAGAFQDNNYETGGLDGDPVRAESLDGSGTDNANFASDVDGGSGRMQMFRWVFSDLFRVLEPDVIAKSYQTSEATGTDWLMRPDYNEINLKAEIVLAQDSDPQFPERGCGEFANDVTGKIVLIYRGECEFGTKALNAQNAGAAAAIICNVPGVGGGDGESTLGMAAGGDGADVSIPLSSLAFSDCERIVAEIEKGPVIGEFNNDSGGPGEVSSGFDNGIIAHEYGHGISNRLLGGPRVVGCLTNSEQPGEGISDYFSLVMTAQEGDKGTDAVGIGNFADGQGENGRGIRRFPYSTDMEICPLTYDFIKGQAEHATGEVWAAVLWDIYWAFSELYGWTSDWSDESAGNVRAMKMAMDGMKMAPCDPGFVDMRDALFAADNGEHTCMLWEIFARRGLGYLADQNNANSNADGIESFEPLPTCITTLKIKKEIATLVTPGDNLEVSIEVANHTLETAENVIITDILSPGLSIVDGSTNVPYTVSGDIVTFELGDMETLAERAFTYTLSTDPTISSITKRINSVETSDEAEEWAVDYLGSENTNYWARTQRDAFEGDVSWFVGERDADSDQRIVYEDLTVLGDAPALRFWHRPNCTPIENGGFLEYSYDGTIWLGVNDQFIRGGYNNPITYDNLAEPGLRGFSGNNGSGTFYDSYLDLSPFKGETIDIRFRFATHDYTEDQPVNFGIEEGWFIDVLEMMDLKSYLVEAMISAENAETITDGEKEIIIDSNGIADGSSTDDLTIEGVSVAISPNPASDNVTMKVTSERVLKTEVSLLSLDGRVLSSQPNVLAKRDNYINVDLSEYDSGFYFLQLRSGNQIITKKLIVE